MTIEEIKAEVRKLDPALNEHDEAFVVATLLLASLEVGTDAERLARFTGIGLIDVRGYEQRLRDSGVWIGKSVNAEWGMEDGALAFWVDVQVALGHLQRSEDEQYLN